MNPSPESKCPKCDALIPDDAPHQLCPKCVLAGVSVTTTPGSRKTKTSPPSLDEVAAQFPDLEIVELIGYGGMGAVYKARQPKLERFVALKILSHELSEDAAFQERFNREARMLARLSHPNIVTVFDFGTSGPFYFLLMEYIDGVNLRQAMQAEKFTPAESLALVEDVCSALKFAHEEGVLHRDIKPENILIDNRGRVKIADFGIAKMIGIDSPDDYTLTMTGHSLGSPHYMAPEQIETPNDIDQRADIYSLGVVFYELLTRELPIGRFAPPSERSPIDPRIDEIVMRALEKDRKARYQNVNEVKTGLASIANSPPQPPQPIGGYPPAPPAPPASFGAQSGGYYEPPRSFASFYPPRPITWTGTLVLVIITTILGFISDGLAIINFNEGPSHFSLLIYIIIFFVGITAIVFSCILHHKCWSAIPEEFRATSPGKAVGFLFIPFFNFYWAFISWPTLARGLDDWQRSLGITNITNVYGLAVTYAIMFVLGCTLGWIPGFASFIYLFDLIIFILLYSKIVNTINRIRQHSA